MPYDTPAATRRGFLSLCSGMMAAVGVAGGTTGLASAAGLLPVQAPSGAVGEHAPAANPSAPLPSYRLLPDFPANSMLDHLNREVFAQHLNSAFTLTAAGVDLVLMRATEGKSHDLSRGQESFSLLFRGPAEPLLFQGIYNFSHPQLGQFELFMVPIRQNSEGTFYEVIFNRLVVPSPA